MLSFLHFALLEFLYVRFNSSFIGCFFFFRWVFDGICFCLHWLLGESSHKLDFRVKDDHA